MIITGKNSVLEALNSTKTINRVYILKTLHDSFCTKVVDLCKAKGIRFDFVDKQVLDKLGPHHQGFGADITDFVYSTLDDILQNKKGENNFILVLDQIEDPHNFGSIIRVAECGGVDGIIIENRHNCLVNQTVYKTSCGAVNHVKIAKVGNINDAIKTLQKQNIWVYCAEAGGQSVFESNLTGNIAVVMGSEGFGVGALTKKICDGIISLPMFGKVNSLNVSTATSAIVYEIIRQRNKK